MGNRMRKSKDVQTVNNEIKVNFEFNDNFNFLNN